MDDKRKAANIAAVEAVRLASRSAPDVGNYLARVREMDEAMVAVPTMALAGLVTRGLSSGGVHQGILGASWFALKSPEAAESSTGAKLSPDVDSQKHHDALFPAVDRQWKAFLRSIQDEASDLTGRLNPFVFYGDIRSSIMFDVFDISPNDPPKPYDRAYVLDAIAKCDAKILAAGEAPMSWLDLKLEAYIRDKLGAPIIADMVRQLAARFEVPDAQQELSKDWPRTPAFPLWALRDQSVEGSLAMRCMALAVWRSQVGPEHARPRKQPALLVSVGCAIAVKEYTSDTHNEATVTYLQRGGLLQSSDAHRMYRRFPVLAARAADDPHRRIEVWRGKAGSIEVQSTAGYQTEVWVYGGYGAFAEYLGAQRKHMKRTIDALKNESINWDIDGIDDGGGVFIGSSRNRRINGRWVLFFSLNPFFSPSFASSLPSDVNAFFAIDPDMPPATHRTLLGVTSAYEMAIQAHIRTHLDVVNEDGILAEHIDFAWLADSVHLSVDKKGVRQSDVLEQTNKLFVEHGRLVFKNGRWRWSTGWDLLMESKKKRNEGKERRKKGR